MSASGNIPGAFFSEETQLGGGRKSKSRKFYKGCCPATLRLVIAGMEARKVRFGILMAAAVVLPSSGYLLGFTKAQTTTEKDWSAEIKIDHQRLYSGLPGVAALQHADELKLTEEERTSILKIVREDAPALIRTQKEEWDADIARVKKLLSGEEIITTIGGGLLSYVAPTGRRPYEELETKHRVRVSKVLSQPKRKGLQGIEMKKHVKVRGEKLFIILDEKNADALRLTERQQKQYTRLASYFCAIMDTNKMHSFEGTYETLDREVALARLKNEFSDERRVFFLMQAEDFLDPIQVMQLRALVYEREYVPVP